MKCGASSQILRSPDEKCNAFTLVELLVSMAVLTLLILFVAQLTKSTTDTTGLSTKQAQADNIARNVFNMMQNDFDGMLIRPDVDYIFMKNDSAGGANDSMFFYSDAVSYARSLATRTVLVGYRIPTIPNRADSNGSSNAFPAYVLERVAAPMYWMIKDNNLAVQNFLIRASATVTNPSPTPDANSTFYTRYRSGLVGPTTDVTFCNGDFRNTTWPTATLSDEVFRLEFCFKLKTPVNNNIYLVPASGYSDASQLTMRRVGSDVSAVIVGIAVLDKKTRVLVSNMAKLVAALPDVTTTDVTGSTPKLMAQKWNAAITTKNFAATAGVPVAVASQVRVYQRTFYLHTN